MSDPGTGVTHEIECGSSALIAPNQPHTVTVKAKPPAEQRAGRVPFPDPPAIGLVVINLLLRSPERFTGQEHYVVEPTDAGETDRAEPKEVVFLPGEWDGVSQHLIHHIHWALALLRDRDRGGAIVISVPGPRHGR